MSDVLRITALKLLPSSPTPRRAIAKFDLWACGIEISGCELIRTAKDTLSMRGPIGCTFTEARLHRTVKDMALRAYLALGGDDLPDWARPSHASASSTDA